MSTIVLALNIKYGQMHVILNQVQNDNVTSFIPEATIKRTRLWHYYKSERSRREIVY